MEVTFAGPENETTSTPRHKQDMCGHLLDEYFYNIDVSRRDSGRNSKRERSARDQFWTKIRIYFLLGFTLLHHGISAELSVFASKSFSAVDSSRRLFASA